MYVCVPVVFLLPLEARQGSWVLELELQVFCEVPGRCPELNLAALLAAEPFLQPVFVFKVYHFFSGSFQWNFFSYLRNNILHV